MVDENGELWTHRRIRHRLSALIEVLPSANGRDEYSQELLKNISEDLVEIRDGLDQLAGDYR